MIVRASYTILDTFEVEDILNLEKINGKVKDRVDSIDNALFDLPLNLSIDDVEYEVEG